MTTTLGLHLVSLCLRNQHEFVVSLGTELLAMLVAAISFSGHSL